MDEQNKVNAIVNIGQMKIAEKAYDDILSDPGKRVSSALSTILDFGNTLLWPVKWVNAITKSFFENNLKKYQERLEAIPEEKIVPVPSEIATPILQRFTYVSNEELSKAFINLLASASNTDTAGVAHPGFIFILDRISSDEAKILKYIYDGKVIARVDTIVTSKVYDGIFYMKNSTILEKKINLTFSTNSKLYLENLVCLGLLELVNHEIKGFEQDYDTIEHRFVINPIGPFGPQKAKTKEVTRGAFILSAFGIMFCQACIEVNQSVVND